MRMSIPTPPERVRADPVVTAAAPYLAASAVQQGGRNTRPVAIPTLVMAYTATSRTGHGVAVAVLGALAGVATWFALTQLASPRGSTALTIVGFVVAAALAAAAIAGALRVRRSGLELMAAVRRWHEVAPEVPVQGEDMLQRGHGTTRLVNSVIGVVAAIGVIVMALTIGTAAAWIGFGLAAACLALCGAAGLAGWYRLRGMLRSAAPRGADAGFAPTSPPGGQPAPAWGPPSQPVPPAQPGQPRAVEQPLWAPPPATPPHVPPVADSAPPRSAPGMPRQEFTSTWMPEPEVDEHTVAAGPRAPGHPGAALVAVCEDGQVMVAGQRVLIGRDPSARPEDGEVALMLVRHETVSKTHALLSIGDHAVYVTDRASTNGTSIVGSDAVKRRLQPWSEGATGVGSTILLGRFAIAIRTSSPGSTQSPPAE